MGSILSKTEIMMVVGFLGIKKVKKVFNEHFTSVTVSWPSVVRYFIYVHHIMI